MTVNKHPINKIDYINYINKSSNDQFVYNEYLKNKYNLNIDMIRLLDLISIDEFLALKMEKTASLFNGKYLFPIGDIYKDYIKKAIYNLISSYDKSHKKQKIRTLLTVNKKNKMYIYNIYKKWMEND